MFGMDICVNKQTHVCSTLWTYNWLNWTILTISQHFTHNDYRFPCLNINAVARMWQFTFNFINSITSSIQTTVCKYNIEIIINIVSINVALSALPWVSSAPLQLFRLPFSLIFYSVIVPSASFHAVAPRLFKPTEPTDGRALISLTSIVAIWHGSTINSNRDKWKQHHSNCNSATNTSYVSQIGKRSENE